MINTLINKKQKKPKKQRQCLRKIILFLFHFFLHLNKLFCDSKTFIKYEFTVIFENLDGDRNFTNCIQDRHYF